MTWEIIKNLTRKIQNFQLVLPTFKVDSVKQSPEQVAKAFSNYFLSITENLNMHIAKDINPLSLLKKYYPPMQIVPVTVGEISIISSLKSKNSFGYDGIAPKIFIL